MSCLLVNLSSNSLRFNLIKTQEAQEIKKSTCNWLYIDMTMTQSTQKYVYVYAQNLHETPPGIIILLYYGYGNLVSSVDCYFLFFIALAVKFLTPYCD